MAKEHLKYQSGFGNHFSSEALPGALPEAQNTPQKVPYGLYAEQLSGTAFTASRFENLRTWFYRIRPSVLQGSYKEMKQGLWRDRDANEAAMPPEPMRWGAHLLPKDPTDFVEGVTTYAVNGGAGSVRGAAIHLYAFNKSMKDRFFCNADGEFLVVPQAGTLRLRTECGELEVKPGEIALIPRGMKFQVVIHEPSARGYLCENQGPSFRLPSLGPIGANGLANPRDFQAPTASYEDLTGEFEMVTKFQGRLWRNSLDHSPLDVVAWHGNYAPYKYDLAHFQAVSPVTFDHPDPSIFTVLTSPSELPGTANLDFVIFPPRWLVMEKSFRPPYFHRNVMSEFMGLVGGVYEAKAEGFVPGGASLHNCMTPHGPDSTTYDKAVTADLKPEYLAGGLAFMFESSLVFRPTAFALKADTLQKNYSECWRNLKPHFDKKGR